MIVRTIAHYLASHKRLVVPQLGTFVVKEPGRSVLFSELLKRDDGVLRGLLRGEGAGELEAAGEIDRFVFEIRHAVEHGEEYRLEGFGVMKPGPNRTIAFAYEPQPQPVPDLPAERPQAPRPVPGAEPRVSASVKMNPEPYVKGLRYGKPLKTTAAYTYVDGRRKKRFDRFLVVAIVAAAIAVAAILFGYIRELREREAEKEYLQQELPTAVGESPQTQTTTDR